jgi:hypothetical protein
MKLELNLTFDSIDELNDLLMRLSDKMPGKPQLPTHTHTHTHTHTQSKLKTNGKIIQDIKEKILRICGHCGNEFELKYKNSKVKFCSKHCYMQEYWKTYKHKQKGEPIDNETFHKKLDKIKKENPIPETTRPTHYRDC